MTRPHKVLHVGVTAMRERRRALTSQSERALLLGTILLLSAVSATTAYFLAQCFSVDIIGSLLYPAEDCWADWGMNIGRHCFSDYAEIANVSLHASPGDYPVSLPPNYQPVKIGFPAAGRIPHTLFALPAHWLGTPRLGLIGYLVALVIAVLTPAVWAARGAHNLERVVVFVTLGAAAIPAWAVIDRGNSAGFLAPIALVFFVALTRRRWGLVTVMVILAAMLKPQFAVLALVLFVARQWRWGGAAFVGIGVSQIAALLLWPRGFPGTIVQSVHDLMKFNNSFAGLQDARNVSFARALLLIPDALKSNEAGKIPADFLLGPRTLIGLIILFIVAVSVLALGRRIPPVMVGIVLLATAALSPSYASFYYLVFALPVAALVVRDPNGPLGVGIFDQPGTHGDRRRAVGVCLSLAAAFSLAQIAILGAPVVHLPIYGQLGVKGVIGSTSVVQTTVTYTPLLWLLACVMIIVSYARKPAPSRATDEGTTREGLQDAAVSTSSFAA